MDREPEDQVRSWGFSHVFTWSDGPNAYYAPHSHSGLTTHLILDGEFTVRYPKDAQPSKETFGPGARVDVDKDAAALEAVIWTARKAPNVAGAARAPGTVDLRRGKR
ncbi:MAG: hypothetical protein M1819_004625 [Sarea resinae]|nr:MAG: hypothetical protein M1819_004625 [Sarea resinae]